MNSLIEFAKTFKAEIHLVEREQGKILELKTLANAICNPNYEELMKIKRIEKVFPKSQNWPLSEWSAGKLLATLEERPIPLFLDFAETSCDQAYALAMAHPGLPVVLTGWPFRLSRLVYALLAETENLHFEISSFQLHGGIEDICAKFGAKRLFFGSAAPHLDAAPSVMAIRYARIPEEEKAMIAGGNLRALLGLSGATTIDAPGPSGRPT